MIHTAVIGAGGAGTNQHLPALEANPKADLVAVCDLDPERMARATAAVHAAGFTNLGAMLKAKPLDSVHICTPPGTRIDVARAVAPHVDGILFEKPLAKDLDAAANVRAIVKEYNLTASVVHNKLFTPHFRRAEAAVDEGAIGELVNVTLLTGGGGDPYDSHRGDWVYDLPGAEIGEAFPHQAYRAAAFVNRLNNIQGVAKYRTNSPNGFDGVTVQAGSTCDSQSVIIAVHRQAVEHDQLVLTGTDGQLVVDSQLKATFTRSPNGGGPEDIARTSLSLSYQHARAFAENAIGYAKRAGLRRLGHPSGHAANGHYVLIDRYLDALTEGSDVPVSLSDGKDTIRMMEALRQ